MHNHRYPQKATPCAKTRHATYGSLRTVHPFLYSSPFYPTPKILCFTMLFNRPDTPKSAPSRGSIHEVLSRMNQSRKLLNHVKSRKLKYFGHVVRHPSMEKDIMLGPMPGTRRQGGQRRQWLDDVTDWAKTELPRVVNLAEDRREFRMFVRGIVQAPHGV